jgi:sec-independent protein translocase protein TatA
MRLGPMEIALVLVIVLIVFGVGKLPQIGGALGKGIHEFRKAQQGEDELPKPEEKTVHASTDVKPGP